MYTIKHTLTLYPSKSSEITTKSQTFQKIIRLLAEHNSIWHFAIYQSKDFSPLNAIKYILKYLQHTLWTPSSIHLRSTHQNPQRSQLYHRHFRKLSDFSRNTIQFTLCDLPIKRLLASKCNIYILKYLAKYLYPFIAEHNSIWHIAIYQSKDSSPLNAIKININHLQHTFQKTIRLLINTIQFDTLRFTNTSRLIRNQI